MASEAKKLIMHLLRKTMLEKLCNGRSTMANPPKSGSKSKQVRFSEYAGYTECRDCEELSAHA
jgi:hypothetical protein